MNSRPLANLSPVEADTLLLARLRRLELASRDREYAADAILSRLAERRHFRSGSISILPGHGLAWNASEAECRQHEASIGDLIALVDGGKLADPFGYVPGFRKACDHAAEAQIAVDEVEDEYGERPWSRYWLVTSSDGHIHARTCCSTCNKGHSRTRFALVPYLSGSEPQAAVDDLGPALCSVCFPAAPVESREQARISARVALVLAEEGCEAFKAAREKAAKLAGERSAKRCPGSGAPGGTCPVCGYNTGTVVRGYVRREATKVRAHNRPVFHVRRENRETYRTEYLTDSGSWGPSTKRAGFETREAAEAAAAGVEGVHIERR